MTLYKFTPDIMGKEVLQHLTVGREELFKELLNKIRKSAEKKTPFYLLLIGPRGIGKSHLLLLIYYRIKDTPELSGIVEPIKLSEEEYSISKLSDLFHRILEEEGVEVSISGEESIIERATDHLNKLKKERMPLLLMDNLHLIFGQLTEDDLKRFRSILQEQNNLIIIGAAPSIFGEIASYEQPFYNFFEVQFLKDLNDDDVEELVMKKLELEKKEDILKEFEKYRPKIRAITVLTGGNPRLVISLCDILCKPGTLIDIESALLTLLDELTPFYQARMEKLPGQPRKIFDTLATADGPLTPTEIAKLSGYDVNVVNVQLKRMEETGFVEPLKFRRKKKVNYEVKERLFRIWREMRFPLGRKRISLFVNFLKLWYSKEELIKAYYELMGSLRAVASKEISEATRLVEHLWYIQEAIGAPTKYKLIESRVIAFLAKNNLSAVEKEISALKDIGKKDKKVRVLAFAFEAMLYDINGECVKGLKSAREAVHLERGNPLGLVAMIHNLESCKQFEKAIDYADLLLQTNDRKWKIYGLFRKADLLDTKRKYVEALEAVNKAIEYSNEVGLKANFLWVLKGNILRNMNNREAIECLNKAIELDPNDRESIVSRAIASFSFEQEDEAEKWIDKGLSVEPEDIRLLLAESFLIGKRGDTARSMVIAEKCLELGLKRKDPIVISVSGSIMFYNYVSRLMKCLKEGEVENAKAAFSNILQLKGYIAIEDFRKRLFSCFVDLFKGRYFDFILQVFDIADKKLSGEDKQILMPIIEAAKYVVTKNVDVLEGLQKEVRQFVVSIIKESSPETPIPKELAQA